MKLVRKGRPIAAVAISLMMLPLVGGAIGASVSAAAAKSPIKIMQIGTFQSSALSLSDSEAGMKAHIAVLNKAGGVNGHQIQVTYCNDNFDADTGAACARQAVSNKDVAVVGGASAEASSVMPILAHAGIPWIGGEGAGGPIEATSTDSYPFQGGTQVMEVGMGRALMNLGAQNVVVIVADTPVAFPAGDAVDQGVAAGGGTFERVLAPIGAPDFSAVAASAIGDNPTGVAIASIPTDCPRIILSLRQAGYTGPITTLSSILSIAAIQALGSSANNVYVTTSLAPVTNTKIPQVAAFAKAMKKLQPQASLNNSSLNAWTAAGMFQQLAARITGAITAKSVVYELKHLKTPIVLGSVPAYSGVPKKPVVKEFPRLPTFLAYLAKASNGQFVASGSAFNPLS